MLYTITYPSSIEKAKEYNGSPVPLTETDAVIIKPVAQDPTSAATIGGNSQGTLFIDFTKGNLANVVIRMYGSYLPDPTKNDWYEETIEKDDATNLGLVSLGGQEITLTSNCKYTYHFPIGAFQAYKITVQGTGASNTGSSLKLNVALRIN
jgi:hypothetical protein